MPPVPYYLAQDFVRTPNRATDYLQRIRTEKELARPRVNLTLWKKLEMGLLNKPTLTTIPLSTIKECDRMATDRPRYTVSMDQELFQRIEDYRFEHRYPTRTEAIVELIRLGFKYLELLEHDNSNAVQPANE